MVAILRYEREHILGAVRAMYTEVATRPEKTFHFPTGRAACLFLGYPEVELDRLPLSAVESFAGVGYPFAVDAIGAGDRVLDVGSGSGTDTLIAAHRVGVRGTVYGLDLTEAMREKLRSNAAQVRAHQVEVLAGNAEEIPLPAACVDAVTSNGVLNLVPDKRRAFGELLRVLVPGGRLQIADIAVGLPVSEQCRADSRLWAECIVGALLEADYLDLLRAVGFVDVELLSRFDYFSRSSNPQTREVAAALGAHSIVLSARKPNRAAIGRAGRLLASAKMAWKSFP